MSAWSLAYEGFEPGLQGLREALCTLGNGYFATRGAVPEARADEVNYPGTYVAGLYNRLVTSIAGHTVENEDMVNLPNWLSLRVRVEDGPWLDVGSVELLDHRQELDLRRGVLTRLVRWRDERGRITRLSQRRFVHMASAHLAGLETTITAENWAGTVEVWSGLDGRVTNSGVARYRALADRHLDVLDAGAGGDEIVELVVETNQSHVRVAQAARTRALRDGRPVAVERRVAGEPGYVAHALTIPVEAGRAVTVEKIVTLYTSRDRAISEPRLDARIALERTRSFVDLLERHTRVWKLLWDRYGIALDGNNHVELVLHLHIFHLLQTVSPLTMDLDVGVPARGLHGEAYRGHIFWDELFIFPFLNFENPALSQALLAYRQRRLDVARQLAREAGYEGAMFPWQSGSNGREETQRLHLNPRSGRWLPDNSRLQRHVNIAVAYNIWQHYQVTGNLEFLRYRGGGILIEIARFWASIASYNPALDRFEIRGVMGPDEYHDAYPDSDRPGLDNNAYTNVMAVWVLLRALEMLELLPAHYRAELAEELDLAAEELDLWHEITRKMVVPFHDDGIISQFEGYGDLEELDWTLYVEKYGDLQRLDRILEAEGDSTNRYQVSKQADVLMLLYLLSGDELRELLGRLGYALAPDALARTVAYYLARTSHGSTLSSVVHAWVLARSDRKRSWELLARALDSDIADVQGGTTAEGIHLGAMAGTVDLVLRCLSGMEARGDMLRFNPMLPDELPQLGFSVHYRANRVDVDISKERLRASVRPGRGPAIKLGMGNRLIHLGPGDSVELVLDRPD